MRAAMYVPITRFRRSRAFSCNVALRRGRTGRQRRVAPGRAGLYPGSMYRLEDIACATVARHDMLPEGAVVLAMVSGGADSVALLRLLAAGMLGECAGLFVLHVNHLLRGEDADADEMFVLELCDRLGVPCTSVRVDIAARAGADGLNLEDAGRRVRYDRATAELERRCEERGVPASRGRIATGHTFDDRTETFLARLVAGAGSGGLRSIAPVRDVIIRPLIDARRADVTAYLEAIGQPWCEDATNADTTRERAWVRNELVPGILERNPAFHTVMARTLSIVAEEDALLVEMADAYARDFSRIEEGSLVFDRVFMRTLTRPMLRRTVRAALIGAFPEASRLEFEHTEAIVDGLGHDGFARDLPFGLRAEAEYGKLRISRKRDVAAPVPSGVLHLPGEFDAGAAGVLTARLSHVGELVYGPDRVSIDADAVGWPLVVDSVRDGDRIRPFGMEGTKKVGDLLTDVKVPRRLREAVPVVRDGDRVVWVAGIRLAEDVRVTAATARVAELVWHRPQSGTNPLSE